VNGPGGALATRTARPRTVLLANLLDTQFVEVFETEVGCFVSQLEEAVEPSTGSTRW